MTLLRSADGSGHGGFAAPVGSTDARRRLGLSASVIIVLGLAIAASLFAFRSEREIKLGAAFFASTVSPGKATPVTGG